MPSDCGCKGAMKVLRTLRCCEILCSRRDSTLRPLSLCSAPGYSDAAKEVGDQSFRHCRSLLIGNGVGFCTFREIIHSDLEVLVSLVALLEGSCYIDFLSFELDPNVVLVHLTPIPGSAAATCCTDVAQWAPSFNNASFLEPVVQSPKFIQDFVDTQVTFRQSSL
jgi:hypothetical protein